MIICPAPILRSAYDQSFGLAHSVIRVLSYRYVPDIERFNFAPSRAFERFPQFATALARSRRGSVELVSAGDIGSPEVLERLCRIAPVTAIRGNVDVASWASRYPETATVHLGARCFYLLHDLKALAIDPAASGVNVVISGHSHRVQVNTRNGVLFLNPGSAGPKRFKLPITLATLDLDEAVTCGPIHELDA
ncbi:metallophosphoesterase family protein [Bradyrhizobium sp. 1]|uniref:metallophosphoesterase family protein n=1 Tax=Bradyrhizobium sp. 1 TaxID=241591 RepID=UPI001FFB3B97|nr:metallophosphoesterase family protein [Bradyrhizobium sp. 1]